MSDEKNDMFWRQKNVGKLLEYIKAFKQVRTPLLLGH